jgi:hypothetical protein
MSTKADRLRYCLLRVCICIMDGLANGGHPTGHREDAGSSTVTLRIFAGHHADAMVQPVWLMGR